MSLSEPVKEFEGKLGCSENEQIIRFLKLYQPSAHTDIVGLLVKSAEGLKDTRFYCPDTDNHAYYLAHTPNGVIYAAAIGLSALMYRLPKQSMSAALVGGGEIFKDIGEPWVSFNPFWPEADAESEIKNKKLSTASMKQWCKLAYHYALS
ncbi:hypothetical protein MNBD_GAMMA09-897 [hydrothermal vent metagenome]|uniref:Uncharacterized protein n=1 Tax=hydrothermal vent metagenome TaxID=652676 RepID=A0A3B0X127_9ZZZZ